MSQAILEQKDVGAHRALTGQLAEDLGWLEGHCRRQPDLGQQANQLRYAGALVRNVLGPFLDGQPAVPLHVAVVGGAGTGKSTVANLLCGALLAEANPQAGFTRHPVAYLAANSVVAWPAYLHFLGPLKKLSEPSPSSLDADVYQIRKVPVDGSTHTLLGNFAVWDCPDMTTWAAGGYIPRLVEAAALADVVVYVASDERYNDEVPTQFLHLLIRSGKAVVVVLTKMRPADAPAFVEHFRQEVLGKVKATHVPVLTVPFLTREEAADPVRKAQRYQIPLLNQVAVLAEPVQAGRQRNVKAAAHFLTSRQDDLLGVARADLTALQTWRNLVHEGQIEFDQRYRQEYLGSERFHRFDEALVRLLELMELPGVGKVVSTALYVVRTPYRLLKGLFDKAVQRPPAPAVPEQPVLDQALRGWLDMLRKEAARRAGTHPLWKHIDKGFAGGLEGPAREQFERHVQTFHKSQQGEAERIARAIYEDLEKDPVKLNTLRGGKFALEVSAIALATVSGGLSPWDLLWGPLAASVTHQLVELLGKQYVDSQREQARQRQMQLVTQLISGPLNQWLTDWPTTGGSEFERLQLALRRIPPALHQVDEAVKQALA